ncbi:MAG: pore-forming ESAT-6 family protein [Candidatus Faecousia sp.]|nr:pore-forming ESAT-6 family protein [Candidatus Faecousia sp.]
MAGGIKVTTQVLTETASKIRTINANMDNKLTNINEKMNALQNTWQSAASDDIRAAMNAMKPRFEEYKRVVESYAKFLDTTAQSYETTETTAQNNASAFK